MHYEAELNLNERGIKMRLCFGAFGRVLKHCKLRANSQNKLIGTILRSVDSSCRIEGGSDWDNAVNLLLNCETGLPNGNMAQGIVATRSTSKVGDPLGHVITEAQKADPEIVSTYFKNKVLPLLDPNKIKWAILAFQEIIAQDDIIDSDTIVDVIGNKNRKQILAQNEFVTCDFFASIFLFVAIYVDNKLGKNAVDDITYDFVSNFETQSNSISLVLSYKSNSSIDPLISDEMSADCFFETVTQTSLKTIKELVDVVNVNAIVAPPTTNITNINGDNYTGNSKNRSLGRGNTFNAPIYMGKGDEKE